LNDCTSLSGDDWYRGLAATEIALASNVFGTALDWETVTGLDDSESVKLLRSVQRKMSKMPRPQALIAARLEAREELAKRTER
jgi:hypothetical protein